MPAEGEEALRLHLLDPDRHRQVRVLFRHESAVHLGAGTERRAELNPKPCVELRDIGQRAPHARARRVEHDLLLDAIARCRGPLHHDAHLVSGSLSGWRSSSTSRSMRVSQSFS